MKKIHFFELSKITFFVLVLLLTFTTPSFALDTDGDGVQDESDNCPMDWNPDQIDTDEDGIGDICTVYHCVTNGPELQQVLIAAQTNNMYNYIMLEQGRYTAATTDIYNNPSNIFLYYTKGIYGITLAGGYKNGCTARDLDPQNTVLFDGTGSTIVLSILNYSGKLSPAGKITVEGITSKSGTGGVIVISSGEIYFSHNIVSDNKRTTSSGFGGVSLEARGKMVINNNIITRNRGDIWGGGLYIGSGAVILSGDIFLYGNIITENSADDSMLTYYYSTDARGGGIYLNTTGNTVLINNIIAGNRTSSRINGAEGGGIYADSNNLTLINNTITGNISESPGIGSYGGGIIYILSNNGIANFFNNIIWGNSAYSYGDIFNYSYATTVTTTTNAFNNNYDPSKTFIWQAANEGGNINVNPVFVNPSTRDYHLSVASPLRNMGGNSAPYLPTEDFEGNPRITEGITDIGADEYNPVTVSFNANPVKGTLPLTVNFTDQSSSVQGPIVAWAWDFNNDGITDSTVNNPVSVFSEVGSYSVSLMVTDSSGNINYKIKEGYITTTDNSDNDRDGISDYLDNCPATYNPLQTDQDTDGIGDACDTYTDSFIYAGFIAGLKSATLKETSSTNVTSSMKDGILEIGKRVALGGGKYNVMSFRSNTEASKLSSLILKIHVNNIYKGTSQGARIFAYNVDGTSVQSTSLGFTISSGWNHLDLTPLLPLMKGFGFIKIRITPVKNWFEISEAYFIEQMNSSDIVVSPSQLNFGSIVEGTSTVLDLSISNTSKDNLIISQITQPSGPFSIASDNCTGISLPTSSACLVSIRFSPATYGTFAGILKIFSNDINDPKVIVNLTGEGLKNAATLTVKVMDSYTGLSLSNVSVTVTDAIGSYTAITDAIGNFTFTDLLPGNYTANFEKTAYFNKTINKTLLLGQNTLNVYMIPLPATLTGTVTDLSNDLPLSNAVVKITDRGGSTTTISTDINGIYTLSDMRPGNFTAIFEKPGYIRQTINDTVGAGETKVLNIQLPKAPPLLISITSPPDNSVVSSSLLTVSGTFTNNASVSVNGYSATTNVNTFTVTIPLHTGQNTVTATAYDSYKQTASHSITVTLTGLLDDEEISVEPSSLNFGSVTVGSSKSLDLTIRNIGAAALTIYSISATYPFIISSTNDYCSNKNLSPLSYCKTTIKFAPVSEGALTIALYIPSNDADHPGLTVNLSGTGIPYTAEQFLLPDTGIKDCYDAAGNLANCIGLTSARGQDGNYSVNPPSYADNANGTVTDINTELVWQKNVDNVKRTWATASAYCENLTTGGYTDWRMPTRSELLTIVDYGKYSPSIDTAIFPGTDPFDYWSASTTSVYENQAYIEKPLAVNFNYGEINIFDKSYNADVRCVRGRALPPSFYVNNGDDTTSELSTGLMWMNGYFGAPTNPMDWKTALYACENIALAGYYDWRLPNIKELTYFNTNCSNWSSSTSQYRPVNTSTYGSAYIVTTCNDTIIYTDKTRNDLEVRCVRGGWGYIKSSISGTVTDSVTNQPIASATVTVTDTQNKTQSVSTGNDGKYTITDIAPGSFTGSVSKELHESKAISGKLVAGQVLTLNVQLVSNVPPYIVTTLGDYGNVTVMEVTGNYDAMNPDGSVNSLPRQEISKEFLRNHQDEYDFYVIFSNFDFQMPEPAAKAFYLEVKNDTQGIGKLIFDDSPFYGSVKLQGIIDMGNISNHPADPIDPKFEDTLKTLSHEQMHRWGAKVKFRDSNNNISTALLGKDGEHWSYLLDTDASVVYGNDWRDNKDGTFTSTGKEGYYSSLDLYLMGLIGKTQVQPMLLIDNPNIDPVKLPEVGVTVSGTAKSVTIDDIIAAEGQRVPDASTSQKNFKTAFIFISRPGTFAGDEQQGIENIRNAWAGRFASLTGGKGSIAEVVPSIKISISSPSNNETVTKPYVSVKGVVINSTGNETGITVNGIPATIYGSQFIANNVSLTEGSNTINITATDTAGNTATTSITVNAVTTGNYIRLTSNIESGISPLELVLRVDGSFSVSASDLHVSGPTQPEVISSSPEEYRLKLIAEGIYNITATSTGPDNIAHQDTITIVILNREQLDRMLKGKWEGMKEALRNGDINAAISYFSEDSREEYNEIFTTLNVQLPSLIENMREITISDVICNIVEYYIKRFQRGVDISYFIYIVKDRNGIWRISSF